MFKINRFMAIGIVLFVAFAIVGVVAVWAQTSKPRPVVKIDLRTSRLASQIVLPSGIAWSGDTLGVHDVHVQADLPGGRSYQFDLEGLLIERNKDGLVEAIDFVFYTDTIENVYALAVKFAKDWGVATKAFDDWQVQARGGRWSGDAVESMNNGNIPAFALTIRDSLDDSKKKPARICCDFVWMSANAK